MEHLVYCDTQSMELESILSGRKTLLHRGSHRRKAPYGKVSKGDALFFALDEGISLIRGKARVKSVTEFSKKTDAPPEELLEKHASKLQLTADQKEALRTVNYLCIVELEDVVPLKPLAFQRPSGRSDWEVLAAIEDIL